MLKIIDKPSPLMAKAISLFKAGLSEPVSKNLKNGIVNIEAAESYGGITAFDKTVRTTYKEFKARFLYENGVLRRWKITEKSPKGQIVHKITNKPSNSSGEIYLPDRTIYTFDGLISNPNNMRKYGVGNKLSQEEFRHAVDFIRNIHASKIYSNNIIS